MSKNGEKEMETPGRYQVDGSLKLQMISKKGNVKNFVQEFFLLFFAFWFGQLVPPVNIFLEKAAVLTFILEKVLPELNLYCEQRVVITSGGFMKEKYEPIDVRKLEIPTGKKFKKKEQPKFYGGGVGGNVGGLPMSTNLPSKSLVIFGDHLRKHLMGIRNVVIDYFMKNYEGVIKNCKNKGKEIEKEKQLLPALLSLPSLGSERHEVLEDSRRKFVPTLAFVPKKFEDKKMEKVEMKKQSDQKSAFLSSDETKEGMERYEQKSQEVAKEEKKGNTFNRKKMKARSMTTQPEVKIVSGSPSTEKELVEKIEEEEEIRRSLDCFDLFNAHEILETDNLVLHYDHEPELHEALQVKVNALSPSKKVKNVKVNFATPHVSGGKSGVGSSEIFEKKSKENGLKRRRNVAFSNNLEQYKSRSSKIMKQNELKLFPNATIDFGPQQFAQKVQKVIPPVQQRNLDLKKKNENSQGMDLSSDFRGNPMRFYSRNASSTLRTDPFQFYPSHSGQFVHGMNGYSKLPTTYEEAMKRLAFLQEFHVVPHKVHPVQKNGHLNGNERRGIDYTTLKTEASVIIDSEATEKIIKKFELSKLFTLIAVKLPGCDHQELKTVLKNIDLLLSPFLLVVSSEIENLRKRKNEVNEKLVSVRISNEKNLSFELSQLVNQENIQFQTLQQEFAAGKLKLQEHSKAQKEILKKNHEATIIEESNSLQVEMTGLEEEMSAIKQTKARMLLAELRGKKKLDPWKDAVW